MARLLLIEDDLLIAKVLGETLVTDGHSIETAYEANEGFRLATEKQPDLILMDVMLPDATGFQTVHRFRQDPATSSIPIILMSGAATHPNQQRLGNMMGADDYVIKPINMDVLQKKIHRLLNFPRITPVVTEQYSVPESPSATLFSSPAARTSSGPAVITVFDTAIPEKPSWNLATSFSPKFNPIQDYSKARPRFTDPDTIIRSLPMTPNHSLKLPTTLVVLHLALTAAVGMQNSVPVMEIARSLSKTLEMWAALVGLMVLAAGLFRVSFDARSALKMIGWVGLPLVLKTFLQVMGVSFSFALPMDIFAVLSVVTMGFSLREFPGGTYLKSLAAMLILLVAWILIFPS